jgi:hypothetical protein
VRAINWEDLVSVTDVQQSYDMFSDRFFFFYNLYFPVQRNLLNKTNCPVNPWMTKGLLISRKRKIFLCTQSLKKPNLDSHNVYKSYRNMYNKIVKLSKKMYYEAQLSENQSNTKITWQILRRALNLSKKNDNSIQKIIINNECITDPKLMANKFNEFFSNIAKIIVNKIEPVNQQNPQQHDTVNVNNPVFSFSSEPVTCSEIIEAAEELQSKSSEDFMQCVKFSGKKI